MPTLPTGYKELEYIESTGKQYCSTGYNTGTTLKLSIEMDVQISGNGCLFSAASKSGSTIYEAFARIQNSKAYFNSGTAYKDVSAYLPRFTLKCDYSSTGKSLSVNGNVLMSDTDKKSMASTTPIYLFVQRIYSGSTLQYQQYASMRMYSCRIYNSSGTLVRDFVPVKDDSGVAGLYDTVNSKFYRSATSTAFVAGSELSTGGTTEITVSASPASGGTVSGGGTYSTGDSVTVTASAKAGYRFTGWTENGSSVSKSASYTFTAAADRALTAVFEEITKYRVSVSAEPSGGGTVSGGGSYEGGDTVTVTAKPADGYTFTGWHRNGLMVSNQADYEFQVTENVSLTAVFQKEEEGGGDGSETDPTPTPPPVHTASVSGLDRRELFIDARDLQSDSDPDNPISPEDYELMLKTRGKTKLAECPLVESFDAEVRTLNPTYQYGVDFFLGDTVTVIDKNLNISIDAVVMGAERGVEDGSEKLELSFGYASPTLHEILKRKVEK